MSQPSSEKVSLRRGLCTEGTIVSEVLAELERIGGVKGKKGGSSAGSTASETGDG
jgi:hypothetical protein